ncbi:serine aminopeptidase domain-containing protein [Aquimarina pacifica]|uniref:serine aminopeptidase domain-containing protein n=1 Tax=Aquimarina pacifica TaxID=1296415 RepID=UPI000470AF26|nr:alpha/beta hydrolase [Aquimarina pacifica]
MEYLYIEKKKDQLYSVYHEPTIFDYEEYGVILCYPYGQEYIRCHKLYTNLATKLAQEGFHTLRFDYYGTGDSSGDFSEINSMDQSLEDIELAVKELKEACGVKKVFLIGARIGATLALLHSKKAKIDGLVLWSPITSGKNYLNEISSNYKEWLEGSFTNENELPKGAISSFGFLYNASLVNSIQSIEFTKEDFLTQFPTLIIDQDDPKNLGTIEQVTFENIINKEFWLKREKEKDKSLVPVQEINKIINWIKTV